MKLELDSDDLVAIVFCVVVVALVICIAFWWNYNVQELKQTHQPTNSVIKLEDK